MNLLITVSDEDELKELRVCATDNSLTVEQYASGIISQWLKTRVRNEYVVYANKLTNTELKDKFGDYYKLNNK